MNKRALLLNNNYEIISFINYHKVAKLFSNGKIEVISCWDDEILNWPSGHIKMPSIVRLKYYVRPRPKGMKFNRINVFRRDLYLCQYCGVQLTNNKITIDHIVPRAKGGKSSWENCVCCCRSCNIKKSSKTLEEAKMKLLNQPYVPGKGLHYEYKAIYPKHSDWDMYFVK